jgi:YD repeat-containing protein
MGRKTHETILWPDGTPAITTKYEYDAMGRQTTVIENYQQGGPQDNETNLTTVYEYDGHGLLLFVTNPKGVKTKFEYDHRNWLIKKTDDAGIGSENLNLVTEYDRDGNGNVWKLRKVTTPQNQVTEYHYDAADFIDWSIDAEGYKTTFKRDGAGMVKEMRRQRNPSDNVDPGTNSTLVYSATYDGLHRVLSYKAHRGDAYASILFQRTYDFNSWSSGGGGCGCSGLGTDIPYQITSTAVGEVAYTYHDVDLLGRVKKKIEKYYDSALRAYPGRV